MNDGIIKENGTSRLMRASLPATYEEFRLKAAAGTQPLDIMFNADGWTQLPTFLNTANLLKAATAALYGFGADATPNDVFSKIFDHVDAILTIQSGTEDPATLLDNLLDEYIAKKRDKSAGFVCYATSVAHPVLGGFSYIIKVNVISQNYVSLEAVSYYVTGTKRFTRSKYAGGWGDWIPEANFSTITYVGTGTYGDSKKNSVTFTARPKMVFVSGPNSAVFPGTAASGFVNSDGYDMIPFSWSGNTLSWYNAQDPAYQLNENGVTYTCLALYL